LATIKTVLKNSGIYGISNILMKGIGFFLLPLYTAYLTTDDYGILSVVNSYSKLLAILFTFSLGRTTVRFYFIYKKNPEDVKKLWGTIITFIYVAAFVIGGIFMIFNNVLISPFIKNINFYPYVLLGMITVMFNPAFAVYQSTLQARHQAVKFGAQNIVRFLFRLIIVITLVVVVQMGVTGVLLANALTSVIFFIYAFIVFRKDIILGFNKKMLKKTLSYSVPLIPRSLANWAYGMISTIFLNNMKSASSAGIYSIGFQFGYIVSVVVDSVHNAFRPWFYENMENGEKGKEIIISYANAFTLFYACVALIISLFGKEILFVMVTEKFREAWVVIPFVTFSFVFSGIYYFFMYPVEYSLKGAKYLNIPTFISAGINVGLNLLLIPYYGLLGAAITTLVAHIVSASITFQVSKRFEYIKYNWIRMYSITILFFILSFVSFAGEYVSFWILLSIKVVMIGSIFFIIKRFYKNEFDFFIDKLLKKFKLRKT
jgi:O-antigen/teichoic acid export membrane protein